MLITPEWDRSTITSQDIGRRLTGSGFLMAHRVLRSFLDAQLVVFERLAALKGDQQPEDKAFLNDCEAVGKQMLLQGRLHGPESLSRELFNAAMQLADNHGLIKSEGLDLAIRRKEAASRARELVQAARTAESLDASMRAEVTGDDF